MVYPLQQRRRWKKHSVRLSSLVVDCGRIHTRVPFWEVVHTFDDMVVDYYLFLFIFLSGLLIFLVLCALCADWVSLFYHLCAPLLALWYGEMVWNVWMRRYESKHYAPKWIDRLNDEGARECERERRGKKKPTTTPTSTNRQTICCHTFAHCTTRTSPKQV